MSSSEEVNIDQRSVPSCQACHHREQSCHRLHPVYTSEGLQEVWPAHETKSHFTEVCAMIMSLIVLVRCTLNSMIVLLE